MRPSHDTFPVDQFNRIHKDELHHDDFSWLLSNLTQFWSFLPSDSLETLAEFGFYSYLYDGRIRVVALNTQFGDPINMYTLLGENQKMQQWNWLIETLSKSEANGEKVILIGHIPPGRMGLLNEKGSCYADDYFIITERFKDTIIAHLYGHTHNDEFEMLNYNDTRQLIYISPALTPGGNNPTFRVYHFQNDTIVDYVQYYTNLSQANENNL